MTESFSVDIRATTVNYPKYAFGSVWGDTEALIPCLALLHST